MKARIGSVLGKRAILKMYFFPGQKTTSDHVQIPGAPHVFKVHVFCLLKAKVCVYIYVVLTPSFPLSRNLLVACHFFNCLGELRLNGTSLVFFHMYRGLGDPYCMLWISKFVKSNIVASLILIRDRHVESFSRKYHLKSNLDMKIGHTAFASCIGALPVSN